MSFPISYIGWSMPRTCFASTHNLGAIFYYMHCMFNHEHRSCFIWKDCPWLNVVFTHEARIEASPCHYISIVKIGIFFLLRMRSGLIFHDGTTHFVLTRPEWLISLLENNIAMCIQCAANICMRFLGSVTLLISSGSLATPGFTTYTILQLYWK